jgi:hypothetical protein
MIQVLRAELATGRDRKRAFDRARAACRRAKDHARFDNTGLPAAHRSAGNLEWLRGNLETARQLWQRSIDEAKRMRARNEVGLTLLEIGSRLGDRHYLEQAERVLTTCGAELHRRRASDLLMHGQTTTAEC